MPEPFPHHYKAFLEWTQDRNASLSAANQPRIVGGPPPQFDGSASHWSPEELLLSSIQLCLMTTFFSIISRKNLVIQSYKSEIEGTLEKTADGLRFTRISLRADVESEDAAKAREFLQTAKKYCIISNSLNVPVELV